MNDRCLGMDMKRSLELTSTGMVLLILFNRFCFKDFTLSQITICFADIKQLQVF